MKKTAVAALAAGVAVCAAGAQPVFLPTISPVGTIDPGVVFEDESRLEARFRADATNWDSRFEMDSFPNNGDLTANVGNGRGFFENRSFDFSLSYDAALELATWAITSPSGAITSLSMSTAGFDQLNVIQLFTTGSRGSVTLTGTEFNGLGITGLEFSGVNTAPAASGGPTFAETFLFFGDDFDLLAGDWSLTGVLSFGTFTSNNPSEGSRITVKLRDAFTIPVPAPGAAAVLAVGGLAGARRRRA